MEFPALLNLVFLLLEVHVKDTGLETKMSAYLFLLKVTQGKITDIQTVLQTRTIHSNMWMVRNLFSFRKVFPFSSSCCLTFSGKQLLHTECWLQLSL